MRRRTLLSTLAVMFAALMMSLMATTNEATAQQYTLDVKVAPGCFPFNVHTYWAGGFPIQPVAANGITVHPVAFPCPSFFAASINGLFPLASFNNPVTYNVNGCLITVRISFDALGCPVITIR